MNEDKPDLFKKFDRMSQADLQMYKSAGRMIGGVCTFFGVSILLLSLFVQSMIFTFVGAVIVYILANVGCSADETVWYVKQALEKFEDK